MSCAYRVMRKRELIFDRFLNKFVQVKASGYTVEGQLLKIENSMHGGGFGNILLQTKEGMLVLVRGLTIQSIGEVEARGSV